MAATLGSVAALVGKVRFQINHDSAFDVTCQKPLAGIGPAARVNEHGVGRRQHRRDFFRVYQG
jgi:hypothetical protein